MKSDTFSRWKYAEEAAPRRGGDFFLTVKRNVDHEEDGETYTYDEFVLVEGVNLLQLLEDLRDPDECSFDHHGGCQAHGYLSLEHGERCPQSLLAELIDSLPTEVRPT